MKTMPWNLSETSSSTFMVSAVVLGAFHAELFSPLLCGVRSILQSTVVDDRVLKLRTALFHGRLPMPWRIPEVRLYILGVFVALR